jgi:hypothetical protein
MPVRTPSGRDSGAVVGSGMGRRERGGGRQRAVAPGQDQASGAGRPAGERSVGRAHQVRLLPNRRDQCQAARAHREEIPDPGDRVRELDEAKAYGVSNTSLRAMSSTRGAGSGMTGGLRRPERVVDAEAVDAEPPATAAVRRSPLLARPRARPTS